MKRGGWFSRLTGRTRGTDPFAAMGPPGGHPIQSSPVGVPVASAPSTFAGPDASNGQFAARPPSSPEHPQPSAHGHDAARVAGAWGSVCDHFALQVMLLTEQLRPPLDQLEEDEQDPERLERLYAVDHAVTRIRRVARDLRVLSDRGDDDTAGPTSSLIDTVRVALSSIERYTQVSIGAVAELAVVGYVGDDVASLLAALLDNATRYSPSTVTISGHLLADGGVMFRIEDTGIGLTAPHVAALNSVLDSGVPEIDDHTARHTGFAVVHRLARKHDIRVQLASRAAPSGASGGTTAMVTVPASLLTEILDAPPAMAPVASQPAESGTDPQATAHLTVARPSARRGPVAAVPDDAPGGTPPFAEPEGEPVTEGTDEGWPSWSAAPDHPVPYEPGTDAVTPNGFTEPAAPREDLPPLPRREPASLRGTDAPPPPAEAPPEPPAEEAAEERRAFAEDVAAFSAAFGAPPGEPSAEDVAADQVLPEETHDLAAEDVAADQVPPEEPFPEETRALAAEGLPAEDPPADQVAPEEMHADDVPPAEAGADAPGVPPDHPHDSEEQVP